MIGEQLLIKLWMQFTTVSTNVVNDVSLARQAEVASMEFVLVVGLSIAGMRCSVRVQSAFGR